MSEGDPRLSTEEQRDGAPYPLLRGDRLCRTREQSPLEDEVRILLRWRYAGKVPQSIGASSSEVLPVRVVCCEIPQTVSVCLCVRYRVVTKMV
jgi:hypothetical protein